MNIYLIGYRCTGKSSAGKLLAANLGMKFTDTDVELVSRAKKSISEIIESEGWNAFREMEKIIIKELSEKKGFVISTGGGVVLDQDNVTQMKKTGIIVWLRATPSTIRKRMEKDSASALSRPALTVKGSVGEIEETLSSRCSIYEKAMDFYVDTDYLDVSDVSRDILKHVETVKEKR